MTKPTTLNRTDAARLAKKFDRPQEGFEKMAGMTLNEASAISGIPEADLQKAMNVQNLNKTASKAPAKKTAKKAAKKTTAKKATKKAAKKTAKKSARKTAAKRSR